MEGTAMGRDEPKFRTVKETAKVLRLGLSTTYKAILEGNIKAIRIAGAIRVPDSELERLGA
jgi:excisionase family DNA binding protein